MKHFLFRGHRVCFHEAGQGEPLVFLHNGGNDHRVWDYQLAHFARTRRVLALDHLGYGESDKPRIDYSLPLYAEMVTRFVDELGPAPVDLVGHCIGAAMALEYARQQPHRVRSLVLFHVATEKTLLSGPLGPTYHFLSRHRWLRNGYLWLLDRVALPRKVTAKGLRDQYGDTPPQDPEFAAYIHQLYNRPGQMRSLYNLLSNWETFRRLDEFTRPAGFPPLCLFWGRSNHVLDIQAGEELAKRLGPDHFETFPGCGHLLMRERPEAINHRIEAFLARSHAGLSVGSGSPVA